MWNKGGEPCVLAHETTTAVAQERARVNKCEGRVDAMGNHVFYGPVGIAMTRAVGDAVMLRAGVIPSPQVDRYELTEECRIVVATDGVFDVLSNQQVRDVVDDTLRAGGSAQEAADALANTAKRKWLGDLPIEAKVDDITCIVIDC